MSSYMFWGVFKQHVSSFNYEKIRTTGAVLVAISIPIFTSQLEKSREAVDLANIRAAYAEVSAEVLSGDNITYFKTVSITQTDDADWKIDATNVAGENLSSLKVKKGSTVYVSVAPNGTVTINTTVITEDATHKEVK
jgi:hypothetical protein